MAKLQIIAAQHAASLVITVIMNLVVNVCRTLVQMVQNNAPEGFHRRVRVAYGLAVQNVMQIRSAVVEAALLVVQISMYGTIHAKITAHPIVDRMGMYVPKIMQRQHAQVALVFILAMPITVM